MPELTYAIKPAEEGISPVFDAAGFRTAWTEYQGGLLAALNDQVKGTVHEDASVFTTILRTCNRPGQAAVFNYAAQAHNNHFFFSQLTPHEHQSAMPSELEDAIAAQFGSVELFREELLDTAEGMFGNGWVWLVLDQEQQLRFFPTYNAGTPYIWGRRQSQDPNVPSAATGNANSGRDLVDFVATQRYAIMPLFNVCVWQHCYLAKYGVNGKRAYLEDWWKCIDWSKVGDVYRKARDPLEVPPVFSP